MPRSCSWESWETNPQGPRPGVPASPVTAVAAPMIVTSRTSGQERAAGEPAGSMTCGFQRHGWDILPAFSGGEARRQRYGSAITEMRSEHGSIRVSRPCVITSADERRRPAGARSLADEVCGRGPANMGSCERARGRGRAGPRGAGARDVELRDGRRGRRGWMLDAVAGETQTMREKDEVLRPRVI
jgi:hypothetical protein